MIQHSAVQYSIEVKSVTTESLKWTATVCMVRVAQRFCRLALSSQPCPKINASTAQSTPARTCCSRISAVVNRCKSSVSSIEYQKPR